MFKIGNRYYAAVINIKNIKKGKLFKDVTKIKDVTQDIMSSYGNNPKSQFLRTSSMDSIRDSGENVNNNSSGEHHQKQHRTATLSNRMILEKAAQSIDGQKLTPSQRSALGVFQNHLDKLRELEAKKAERQQIIQDARAKGAKPVEYQAATNRRNILATQIKRETTKLLELENTDVLRRVLEQSKRVIVNEQASVRKQALADYRDTARAELRQKKETGCCHKIHYLLQCSEIPCQCNA